MSRRSVLDMLLAALPLLLALLLYGYTLQLPLFLDDGPNFWLVENIDGVEQWGGSRAFPYYRPAVFSLWKLSQVLTGGHDPFWLHLMNVLCLGLFGVLTGQIARRLVPGSGARAATAIAGVSVVVFPFSYQAVTLISSMFHILMALGMAASVWAALKWLDGRRGALALAVCWGGAFVGAFSHENGPMLPPLLVMVITAAYWRADRRPTWQRMAWVVVPVSLIAAVYTLLWFTVPRFETADDPLVWNQGIDVSLAYFLQGLAYPLFALWARLHEGSSVAPGPMIVVVGLVALGGVGWLWWRARSMVGAAVYGLGWYGASLLPGVLFLGSDYTLGSPRLMFLASAGAGIFWGAVLAGLWQSRGTPPVRRAARSVGAGIVAAGLIVSLAFWGLRRDDFTRMGDFTNRLMAMAAEQRIDQSGLVLVNAPNYIAPEERMFLLGAEGTTFMLNDIGYSQQIWANTGLDYPPVEAFVHPPTVLHSGEYYAAHGPSLWGEDVLARFRPGRVIYATHFAGREFWPEFVGLVDAPGPDEPVAVFPAADLALFQADASYNPQRNVITVRTRWQLDQPQPVKLFAHVYCDGAFVTQSDGYVWGNLYPFSMWRPGDVQTDRRAIELPHAVTPDCLRVQAGAYWEADTQRLHAVDPDSGQRFPDDAVPVPVVEVTSALVPLAKIYRTAGTTFAFDADTLRDAVELIEVTISKLDET